MGLSSSFLLILSCSRLILHLCEKVFSLFYLITEENAAIPNDLVRNIFTCQNWEINFDTKFPVKKEDVKLKLFNTYYIGKPLFTESDSYAEVPLLFISQNKKLYVKILINPDEEKMIYQANIEKWENLHDN